MKLFQKSLTCWFSIGCVAFLPFPNSFAATEAPKARQFSPPFDPAKGFKPAQTNLTEIFLQIAGSLEATGSPEGYIRHMQVEHKRVATAWQKKTGKPLGSRMPATLTEEHLSGIIRNWSVLSSPLKLEAFGKEIGRCCREGIMGTRMTGTVAVQFFNAHQKAVAAAMRSPSQPLPGFDALKSVLTKELEFDKTDISLAGYETSRRDAVSYAMGLKDAFEREFEMIDKIATPEKAGQIKSSLLSWFMDLGLLAQAELELGTLESALKRL